MLALFLFVGAASALNIDNFIGSDSNFAAVSKSDFKCKSTGRFTNPDDCSGYILCRKMPDGTFDKSYGFCHGYAFNPKKGTCVPISPEFPCYKRQSRRLRIADPRFKDVCSGNENFGCADCATLITCVNQRAHPSTCEGRSRCFKDGIFGGGVCRSPKPLDNDCKCPTDGKYHKDPYSNSTIIKCNSPEEPMSKDSCGKGLEFNEELEKCVLPDANDTCHEREVVPTRNCSRYYKCIKTELKVIHDPRSCETDKLINVVSQKCEDPCSWGEGPSFSCNADGRFADVSDCNRFYLCLSDGQGGFDQKAERCPSFNHFDPVTQGCVDRAKSKCVAKTRSPTQYCQVPSRCSSQPKSDPKTGETDQTDTSTAQEGGSETTESETQETR